MGVSNKRPVHAITCGQNLFCLTQRFLRMPLYDAHESEYLSKSAPNGLDNGRGFIIDSFPMRFFCRSVGISKLTPKSETKKKKRTDMSEALTDSEKMSEGHAEQQKTAVVKI